MILNFFCLKCKFYSTIGCTEQNCRRLICVLLSSPPFFYAIGILLLIIFHKYAKVMYRYTCTHEMNGVKCLWRRPVTLYNSPTPKITWRREGRTEMEESSGHELVIPSVKPGDKGTYVCSGTNSVTHHGPQEVTFRLDVQGKTGLCTPPPPFPPNIV